MFHTYEHYKVLMQLLGSYTRIECQQVRNSNDGLLGVYTLHSNVLQCFRGR